MNDFKNIFRYREDVLFGEKAYLTTAYFVSPSVICTGRSQAEFDTEGTGNILLFQNGETSMDTIEAPADLDEANNNVNSKSLKNFGHFACKRVSFFCRTFGLDIFVS